MVHCEARRHPEAGAEPAASDGHRRCSLKRSPLVAVRPPQVQQLRLVVPRLLLLQALPLLGRKQLGLQLGGSRRLQHRPLHPDQQLGWGRRQVVVVLLLSCSRAVGSSGVAVAASIPRKPEQLSLPRLPALQQLPSQGRQLLLLLLLLLLRGAAGVLRRWWLSRFDKPAVLAPVAGRCSRHGERGG